MAAVTNTAAGPRGIGLRNGSTVLVNPGQTVEVDLTPEELAEIEGAGWWQIEGKAKPAKPAKADAAA